MNRARSREYLPALGFGWLTPLFDVVLAWTTREEAFRRRTIEQANLSSDGNVLDLGCGTGTLAVRMKQHSPRAAVAGLDVDEVMLGRAQKKAAAANAEIQFVRGFSRALPYKDKSFDRVVSTLFFHHLKTDEKQRTLNEVLRVLKPGGELHIADWGRPSGPIMHVSFLLVRATDGFGVTRDNATGRLPELIARAGFSDVHERGAMNMMFGTLRFTSARRPE
jgi:SAM-dependent methyltransferase